MSASSTISNFQNPKYNSLTLLRDTNSLSPTASGLGVLATNSETPVVPQTTVISDFLESLQVIPELHVESVGHNLGVLAILVVLLPVEEPIWDLELPWVGNHSHQIIKLSSTQFTSSLVHVDIGLLTTDVSKSPSDTFDGGHSKHNFLLPIYVCVQNTKNVLEILVRHQRHFGWRVSWERVKD